MPWKTEYVDADLFPSYKGINLYHVYKHDDIEDMVRQYDYVLAANLGEEDSIYVKDLSNWTEAPHPPFLDKPENKTPENELAWKVWRETNAEIEHIKAILKEAIDKGEIVPLEN